jgi:type IV secretory pathway TraG/TraD family ATPase VirD4
MRVIALKRARTTSSKRVPTYLFIDEFHNFVSPDIEKALTQLRKYRLYLVLASQYIGQCGDKYLQKALLSVGVIIAGQNERKSRKAIEEETGILSSDIENLKH